MSRERIAVPIFVLIALFWVFAKLGM